VHNEQQDDITNVTDRIVSKVGTNLHQRPNHPINTIKKKIENFFVSTFRNQSTGQPVFRTFDDIKPLVSVKENFDDLLFPLDHVGRTAFDTYYLNKTRLLRTHTTTHQTQLLREGHRAFLITGDVYRRDEIDRTHYPVRNRYFSLIALLN
jgi:phenylalanyl-tRNA synthetase alpha chain